MFDLLAPGSLVLTLQSKPPFVVESAFALALTILLAAPLIARVYLLLDEPLKNLAKRSNESRRPRRRVGESLVIRYPARKIADATSSSNLRLETTRKIGSTSAVWGSKAFEGSSSCRHRLDENSSEGARLEARESRRRKRPLKRSPSPIDVSALDYKAYRHRLIEASLRKRYDDYQPPGDVVLNSLHLNSAESAIGAARPNHRYDRSLFDFVREYYDTARVASSREDVGRRPHPLDHFLAKGARRPKTAERHTEMLADDLGSFGRRAGARDYLPASNDNGFPRSPDVDNNGNPQVRSPSQSVSIEDNAVVARNDLDSRSAAPGRGRATQSRAARTIAAKTTPSEDRARRKSPWTSKHRSASAGSTGGSSAPRGAALSRAATLPERGRLIKSPGRRESAEGSRESVKKLEDQPDERPPSSPSEREREEATTAAMNFLFRSSSEIVAVRSERSAGRRPRDETSRRSRESSISPNSRPPWLTGDQRGKSFNRKYGNIAEDSARAGRPGSTRGSSLPRKLTVPSRRGRSSSKDPPSASVSRNPAPFGPRAASFVAPPRTKELIRTPAEEEEEESSRDFTSTPFPPRRRDEAKGRVGKVAVESPRTKWLPGKLGEKIIASRAAAVSGSSLPSKTRPRVGASRDSRLATTKQQQPPGWNARPAPDARKKPVTGRSRDAGGPSKSSFMQDRRAKLNLGEEPGAPVNSTAAKGAPFSSKIALSDRVLSPDDDDNAEEQQRRRRRDLSVDSAKLVKPACWIAPTERVERPGVVPTDAEEETGTRRDATPDNKSAARSIARPRVSGISRDLKARPGSASDLAGGCKPRVPPRRNANSETKSGLSGAKSNARSSGAVGKIKRDEAPVESATPRNEGVAVDDPDEGVKEPREGLASEEKLKLPRHDSKIGLAMNSALKRYIKTLKQGLLDRSNKDGIALASLSLTDAISILSGQKAPLSAEELRELQGVLGRVERHPELLGNERSLPGAAQ